MSAPDCQGPAPSKSAAVVARLEGAVTQEGGHDCRQPPPEKGVELRLRTVSLFDDLGFAVLPLNGKAPIEKGWTSKARPSREQAEDYARRGNIGVRTGSASGGLVILDVDEETPEWRAIAPKLPETWTVRTGSGGEHRFFRAPAGVTVPNSNRKAIPGVDILSDGKQAAAPGSVHPGTGRLYEWVPGLSPADSDRPAELPSLVIKLIEESKAPVTSDGVPVVGEGEAEEHLASLTHEDRERVQAYAAGTLERLAAEIREQEEGGRNERLNGSAYRAGAFVAAGLLDHEETCDVLREAAEQCGLEPREIAATLASGLNSGLQRPIDVLALVERLRDGDLDLERRLGRFRPASSGNERGNEDAFRARRDAAVQEINAGLTEAVQAGTPAPFLQLRESFGFLARNDPSSVRDFKAQLKEHKGDLGGLLLGDFDEFVKEVGREEERRERKEKLAQLEQEDDRPLIPAFGDPRMMLDSSVQAIVTWNEAQESPVVFRRGSALVMVGEDGRSVTVGQSQLGYLLTLVASFYVHSQEEGIKLIAAPQRLIHDLLGCPGLAAQFPELASVSHAPILSPSGAIVGNGYDYETRTLVRSDLRLSVPDAPSREDAIAAGEYLKEHIFGSAPQSGFPFADEASLANAFAVSLTPVIREAVSGIVPMAAVTAHAPGTGKTLFATCAMLAATGTCDTAYLPRDDRELQREVLAPAYNESRRMLIFDNLPEDRTLDSPLLAKVATDHAFAFRAYHTQAEVKGENRMFVVVTGNNVTVGTDFRRRTFWIRLDARSADPEARTGFRHPDLHAWIAAHRAEVLSALFTIARAWYVAGQPEATVPALGSYGEWCRIIGGMLEHAGVQGFLRNLDRNRAADRRAEEMEEFLRFLGSNGFGDRSFTTREVGTSGVSPAESLPSYFGPNDIGDPRTIARRLGIVFGQVAGRRFGTDGDCLWIEQAFDEHGRPLKDRRNVTLWVLRREEV